MKTVSTADIKQELQNLSVKEVTDACLRLARYKKENKELLAFLLFDAHDIETYTQDIKQIITNEFEHVHKTNLYLAKKTLRKILREINKQARFTQSKQAEAELRIHFCATLKNSGIATHKNKALENLYAQQLKKIRVAVALLHEDIQYDLLKQLQDL